LSLFWGLLEILAARRPKRCSANCSIAAERSLGGCRRKWWGGSKQPEQASKAKRVHDYHKTGTCPGLIDDGGAFCLNY